MARETYRLAPRPRGPDEPVHQPPARDSMSFRRSQCRCPCFMLSAQGLHLDGAELELRDLAEGVYLVDGEQVRRCLAEVERDEAVAQLFSVRDPHAQLDHAPPRAHADQLPVCEATVGRVLRVQVDLGDRGRSEEPRLNSSHVEISYAVF